VAVFTSCTASEAESAAGRPPLRDFAGIARQNTYPYKCNPGPIVSIGRILSQDIPVPPRLPWLLLGQFLRRQLAEFIVNERQELLGGVGIAPTGES
jgi:hypothetical protein